MFNVGGPEILVIVIVALVVLGPEQLPKAMRTFGNVMGEIRKVSNGFQAEMRNAMDVSTEPSRTEKPHSATMATPERSDPDPGLGSAAPIDSDGTEVTARNTDLPSDAGTIDDPITTSGTASDRGAGTGPTIDPADRAAG